MQRAPEPYDRGPPHEWQISGFIEKANIRIAKRDSGRRLHRADNGAQVGFGRVFCSQRLQNHFVRVVSPYGACRHLFCYALVKRFHLSAATASLNRLFASTLTRPRSSYL